MAESMISIPDDLAASLGMGSASNTETASVAAEATKVTPAAEATPETTPPAIEKPAESASPKAEVMPPTDGAKTPYKPEEVAEILKEEERTGKVLLDSSRLTPEGRLLQKSFQQGYGPKFEQAKKMREDGEKAKADAQRLLSEWEQTKRDAENKKIFEKEKEELGEDEANKNKAYRELNEKVQRLEWENRQAQNRATSMQLNDEFRRTAPNFHIPIDDDFQDLMLSAIVSNNALQTWKGIPPSNMEESAAMVADKFGFTNVDNLWKIIRANPENETAVKNYYFNEHVKLQAKGPTVSPSSSANVQTPKPTVDNSKKSIMDIVRETFNVPAGEEIKLI